MNICVYLNKYNSYNYNTSTATSTSNSSSTTTKEESPLHLAIKNNYQLQILMLILCQKIIPLQVLLQAIKLTITTVLVIHQITKIF